MSLGEQMIEFFNKKSELLTVFAVPDFKWTDQIGLQGFPDCTVTGHEALAELRDQYHAAMPDLMAKLVDITPAGPEKFFLKMRTTGTFTRPMGAHQPNNKHCSVEGLVE